MSREALLVVLPMVVGKRMTREALLVVLPMVVGKQMSREALLIVLSIVVGILASVAGAISLQDTVPQGSLSSCKVLDFNVEIFIVFKSL